MAKAGTQALFCTTVSNCFLLVHTVLRLLEFSLIPPFPSPKYLASSHPKEPHFVIFVQFHAFVSASNPTEVSLSLRTVQGKD